MVVDDSLEAAALLKSEKSEKRKKKKAAREERRRRGGYAFVIWFVIGLAPHRGRRCHARRLRRLQVYVLACNTHTHTYLVHTSTTTGVVE